MTCEYTDNKIAAAQSFPRIQSENTSITNFLICKGFLEHNHTWLLRSENCEPQEPWILITQHLLTTRFPTCVPDSCIVNIYEEGDCIPPHIDNHDFVRPFCTVSFLSECNIVFGSNLKIVGPGEFDGSIAIPLPMG